MDSEDEDSVDCQCGSSTLTSKCQGHNGRAVCEPLNRESLNQLSGSYSAIKRQDEAGDIPHSGHMAFSSPIVSRNCWVWCWISELINSWEYLFLLPFDQIGCHLRKPFFHQNQISHDGLAACYLQLTLQTCFGSWRCSCCSTSMITSNEITNLITVCFFILRGF